MKLARYCLGGRISHGALVNGKILYLTSLARKFGKKLPRRIEDFIGLGDRGVE
jgi:hypothetical protein